MEHDECIYDHFMIFFFNMEQAKWHIKPALFKVAIKNNRKLSRHHERKWGGRRLFYIISQPPSLFTTSRNTQADLMLIGLFLILTFLWTVPSVSKLFFKKKIVTCWRKRTLKPHTLLWGRVVYKIDWCNNSVTHMHFSFSCCNLPLTLPFMWCFRLVLLLDIVQKEDSKYILSLMRWRRWKPSYLIDLPFQNRRKQAEKDF